MNNKSIKPDLTEGTSHTEANLAQLQEQVKELQMKVDILKETINVLKKAQASIRPL